MPYKRNPMRAERMCGLARFVTVLQVSAVQTASVQWLERTLDDSVNRRLTLPQAFLATDGVLRLALNLSTNLHVNPEVIARNVARALPFMATERVLMEAAAKGDRQALHERIRRHSHAVTAHLKAGGEMNDLLDRLQADPAFAGVDFEAVRRQVNFVGRAPEQVDEFLAQEVNPIRNRYAHPLGQGADVPV
jgi:adenylosuccinate lyase